MPHDTALVPCVHPSLEDALPQYGRLPLGVGDLEGEKDLTQNVLCGGKIREFPEQRATSGLCWEEPTVSSEAKVQLGGAPPDHLAAAFPPSWT